MASGGGAATSLPGAGPAAVTGGPAQIDELKDVRPETLHFSTGCLFFSVPIVASYSTAVVRTPGAAASALQSRVVQSLDVPHHTVTT